jgi:hypothetical protein
MKGGILQGGSDSHELRRKERKSSPQPHADNIHGLLSTHFNVFVILILSTLNIYVAKKKLHSNVAKVHLVSGVQVIHYAIYCPFVILKIFLHFFFKNFNDRIWAQPGSTVRVSLEAHAHVITVR